MTSPTTPTTTPKRPPGRPKKVLPPQDLSTPLPPKRPRGRPTNDHKTLYKKFVLTPSLLKGLEDLAQERKIPVSQLVNELLASSLHSLTNKEVIPTPPVKKYIPKPPRLPRYKKKKYFRLDSTYSHKLFEF